MSLQFVDEFGTVTSNLGFPNINFHQSQEGNYYVFSDKDKNEIKISYPHSFISEWDDKRFDIYLFENPYLTAENDIFQLFERESKSSHRLGWLIPISALDSTEHNFANNSSFKNYRGIAYKRLLGLPITLPFQGMKDNYTIYELFPNLCVCLLTKDELGHIHDFKIENYILAFYKYDYLLFNGTVKSKEVYDKSATVGIIRSGNHKIRLQKSSYEIMTNRYTKALFLDHLLQNENPIVRFIFLYQIFEQLIQINGDILLEEIIRKYQKGIISKNSVKEQLGSSHNDKTLLSQVLAYTEIPSKNIFIDRYSALCREIGEEEKPNYHTALYSFRNLVTHRYRDISYKTEALSNLFYSFEVTVIEFLINYKTRMELPLTSQERVLKSIAEEKISLFRKLMKIIKIHYKVK